jgi:ATP-dependent Clp protease protease subunit
MPKRNEWSRLLNRFGKVPDAVARAEPPRRPSRIRAESGNEATVYLYDVIDSWFGVDAQEFVRELAALDVETIHVRINSPGGSVFDGMAIYNALKQHRAEIVTHVDGLAASAASVIALAGDEVRMGTGAFLMIHNAWGMAIGDADEMRQMADTLEKINGSLVGIYATRTGMDAEEVQALMDAETWFTAEEAIEAGLADAEEEGKQASARAEAPTERDAERALRDAGFSNTAAKAIVASGYNKATPEPRDEDGELAEILAALEGRGTLVTLATR